MVMNEIVYVTETPARVRVVVGREEERPVRICPQREVEVHGLGEFPMTCHACHIEADS
jgi:hypothetical protein